MAEVIEIEESQPQSEVLQLPAEVIEMEESQPQSEVLQLPDLPAVVVDRGGSGTQIALEDSCVAEVVEMEESQPQSEVLHVAVSPIVVDERLHGSDCSDTLLNLWDGTLPTLPVLHRELESRPVAPAVPAALRFDDLSHEPHEQRSRRRRRRRHDVSSGSDVSSGDYGDGWDYCVLIRINRFRSLIVHEVAKCGRTERIVWDQFGDHTESAIERAALALEPRVVDMYIGICPSPCERFFRCRHPRRERFGMMSVLSCGYSGRLRGMERNVIQLLSHPRSRALAKLRNRSRGGEAIRELHGFIYLCYNDN